MQKRFLNLPPGWIEARRYYLLAPLVALVVVALLGQTDLVQKIEYQTENFRFQVRAPYDPPADPRLIFVAIDEVSLSAFGQWPWPRTVEADALNTLAAAGDLPHTIAFDVTFTEDSNKIIEGQNPDVEFAKAINDNYGSFVSGAVKVDPDETQGSFTLENLRNKTDEALKNLGLTEPLKNVLGKDLYLKNYDLAKFPIPLIRTANGSYFGFVNDNPSLVDGIRHSVPLVFNVRGKVFPSLALETLCQMLGVDADKVVVDLPNHLITLTDFSKHVYPIPVTENGEFFINYRRKSSFNSLSLAGLVQNVAASIKTGSKLDPACDVRNKTLFVGENAFALADLGPSPLEGRSPLPFVHLNVINNVLHQDYISFVPWYWVVLGWSLVTWPTLLRLKEAPLGEAVLMPIVVALFYIAFAVGIFWRWSVFVDLAWPVLSYGVVNFGGVVIRWREEAKGRLQLKAVFAQMVSPDIMNHLLKHPENMKLGGTDRASTILFSDIRDYTKFSEGRTASDVMGQLNEYFDRMVACVFESKGSLHKFIGDAVMAAWGDIPDASQGPAVDAHNAVKSALLMRRRLRVLNVEREANALTPIRIGVGLNHGVVQAGMLGSMERKEFTVIGDEVNVASRLEGITKEFHTDIAISESVRRLLGSAFLVRRLGFIQLKGKTKPTLVFEVLTEKANLDDAKMSPQGVARYEAAFDHFLARRFVEAEAAFTVCQKEYPDDFCTNQYLTASRQFLIEPPPPEWDGRIVMTTK